MKIAPKKSLGQNFLLNNDIIKKIVELGKVTSQSNVIEIGPGTGNLTNEILKKNPKFFAAIEKDNNLYKELKSKYKSKIELINQDVLSIDWKKYKNKNIIVFGNLPYNISTEILCKWILNIDKNKFWFESLVLMFQKEVADRIISDFNTKNYGRLSILANWKLSMKKICDIMPSSFYPKPKILSSVLLIKPKLNFFPLKNPKNLEKLTRLFFMHRRKMLKKPYRNLFKGNIEVAEKLKINLNLRPQNLDFMTYYRLTEEYEKLRG